jgi:hypothetical protein
VVRGVAGEEQLVRLGPPRIASELIAAGTTARDVCESRDLLRTRGVTMPVGTESLRADGGDPCSVTIDLRSQGGSATFWKVVNDYHLILPKVPIDFASDSERVSLSPRGPAQASATSEEGAADGTEAPQ